jgi:hypothetical protein
VKGKLINSLEEKFLIRRNITEWLTERLVPSQHEKLKPMPYALMKLHKHRIRINFVHEIFKNHDRCVLHVTLPSESESNTKQKFLK